MIWLWLSKNLGKTRNPETQELETASKFKNQTIESPLQFKGRTLVPLSKYFQTLSKWDPHNKTTSYIVYEKLRNSFRGIIFHEKSPSHILCSKLIYHFLETICFSFESIPHSVCLIQRRLCFSEVERWYFYWKQINERYIWKEKSMQLVWHLTCSTIDEIK